MKAQVNGPLERIYEAFEKAEIDEAGSLSVQNHKAVEVGQLDEGKGTFKIRKPKFKDEY